MERLFCHVRRWSHPRSVIVIVSLGLALFLWLSAQGGSWAMPLQQGTTGCIVGTVSVAGQPSGGTIPTFCQPYTVYVEVCGATIPGCTIPPCTIPAAADAYGVFTVCGIPAGTHSVLARGYNTLANKATGVVVPSGGSVNVNFGALEAGDASAGNVVEILDYSILATAYATSPGDPEWDRRADFNCSGSVDILDYSLLATNYGHSGASCP